MTLVPHTGQVPCAALRPFLRVTSVPSNSRLARHFTQYASYLATPGLLLADRSGPIVPEYHSGTDGPRGGRRGHDGGSAAHRRAPVRRTCVRAAARLRGQGPGQGPVHLRGGRGRLPRVLG